MLNSLELTGRARTHVLEVAELRCTLHAEVAAEVIAVRDAARAAGIELAVVSSFRDFDRQVAIWNAKYRGERALLDLHGRELDRKSLDEGALIDAILLWSALPGASRHHWGTDFDVIDQAGLAVGDRPQLVQAEFAPGGRFARLDDWLTRNMGSYGLFRPYAQDLGGVQPEPWHLSCARVAGPALESLSLEMLAEAVAASSMDGRERVLERLPKLYERYVLAVAAAPAISGSTRPS